MSHAMSVREQLSRIDLYADMPPCRHCNASVTIDEHQGGQLVHVGTRSRRCPGADADTAAEIREQAVEA